MAHAIGSSLHHAGRCVEPEAKISSKFNKSKTDILQAGVLCIGQACDESNNPNQNEDEGDTMSPRKRRKYPTISPSLRRDILERDGHRCQICKHYDSSAKSLAIHHIVPRSVSQRGANEKSNLNMCTCQKCHSTVLHGKYWPGTDELKTRLASVCAHVAAHIE